MDSPAKKAPASQPEGHARISGKQDSDRRLVALGKALRGLRREAGISQENLAYIAGVDRGHMGKIERGERNVTVLNLLRIADALGCKAAEILAAAKL